MEIFHTFLVNASFLLDKYNLNYLTITKVKDILKDCLGKFEHFVT